MAVNEATAYGSAVGGERKPFGRIDPEFWRDEFRKKFVRRLKRGINCGQLLRETEDETAGELLEALHIR